MFATEEKLIDADPRPAAVESVSRLYDRLAATGGFMLGFGTGIICLMVLGAAAVWLL